VTLDSLKTKDGGYELELFDAIRSLGSTSTSARFSSTLDVLSDMISPSSRFSESGTMSRTGCPLEVEYSQICEPLPWWTKH
jgi:hypothetical protein